jgi:SAM-dependent methyltransferase
MNLARLTKATKRSLSLAQTSFLLMRGLAPRECPLCGRRDRFLPYGSPPRFDAECPTCASLERHRQLCLTLDDLDVIAGSDVLHFSPEPCLVTYIQARRPSSYVAVDLAGIHGARPLNIEHMPELGDDSFDLVIASHILEHVDDERALAELRRVLRPAGVLLVMVPIVASWTHTFENPAATTPRERELFFGQADHIRYYGQDIRDRITNAGFEVDVRIASEPQVTRHSLVRGDPIFIGTPVTS